ncbi:Protein PAIR1 [Zea mays]|uniref:Protein PAIR1 n=2 Tax=Zea mays TaxID=4577 RepID=A0A1D6JK92_MAIZE|nr:Protein PAIR1 [Zea mays]
MTGAGMKLKINKACDLSSISVLPPRRTGGSGGAGSSAAAAAVAAGSQQRSQPLSQQSFSQGAVGSGGASSLLHSQSQLSQASLDENLLTLHLASPARDQGFRLHDDSSKKMTSLPVTSASCVREESQLQLAKTSSNPVHRWNPSLPDSRYFIELHSFLFECLTGSGLTGVVPAEDVERKFQHMASSVHKVGMVLDSVQNDTMQLNRAMKEAALDSGSIQQKIVVLDTSMQKNLKGQGDLKVLVESNTKNIADQLAVLNSHSNKLVEISSALSVLPKQIERDLKQQQSDIFRIFRNNMEEIARAVKSLNSKIDAIQMPTEQRCTTNGRPLMNQLPVDRNERPQVNQTPEVTRVSQTTVASLVNQAPAANGRHLMSKTPAANGKSVMRQTPAENGRHLVSQTPAANGKTLKRQTSVTNGISLMSQVPAANGKPVVIQIPAPKGRPMMRQKTAESGRTEMNEIPVASGRPHTNKIPIAEVHPAPLVCPAKQVATDPKPKVDEEKLKALPQKLTSSRSRVAPKQEEAANTKVISRAAATEKVVIFIDDSDDDNDVRASCVILRPSGSGSLGERECDLMKVGAEESQEIPRRARKRRRREMQATVGVACMPLPA